MINIITALIIILFLLTGVIIHQGEESFYYQDLENKDFIVLPNGERINPEAFKQDEFRTKEGMYLYKTHDDNLFIMEDAYEKDW
jgi:hypothetical protein